MANEDMLPDVEGAVREYLRQNARTTAVVGQRILLGVDNPSGFPVVSLQRIGGGFAATDAEGLVDYALLQVDVWGDVHAKASAWAATSAVVVALRQDLAAGGGYTAAGKATLKGAEVQSWLFSPDESERARYIITAQVVAVPPQA